MIKLHNSLSRRVDGFRPIGDRQVNCYSCGPTVYDRVHLGNFKTYIFEDTLRRVLSLNGYSVNHVMNITDIDDKTISRSVREYGADNPQESLKKLTRRYEKLFLNDAASIGIDFSNTRFVRATEHIKDMQELISKIPNKYTADDGVYFDISQFPDYGVLVKLDQSHEHHRINNDEYDKDHVADFALWKAKKDGEPSWDFKIEGQNMPGHPGWHIECSAMSTKYLGQPFDIHTGGVDLMFPHHENEIAQSQSAGELPLANFFVHSQHLIVDGKRMGKRFNNFYTVDDIVKKNFDPMAFRLLVLQAHYQSQLNFTWKALEDVQQVLLNLQRWSDLKFQGFSSSKLSLEYLSLTDSIRKSLNNNLNTSEALAAINKMISSVDMLGADSSAISKACEFIDKIFGLSLTKRKDLHDSQKALLKQRRGARDSNDWQKSDQLRDELLKSGVAIRDTGNGQIWYTK